MGFEDLIFVESRRDAIVLSLSGNLLFLLLLLFFVYSILNRAVARFYNRCEEICCHCCFVVF
jgi:hypothetical protein